MWVGPRYKHKYHKQEVSDRKSQGNMTMESATEVTDTESKSQEGWR